MNTNLELPVAFPCGAIMKNKFMLAPMTNCQSHEDGQLHEDELRWLTMRAQGGFGIVMTCATHVQEIGKGFSGQLGILSDDHIHGHKKIAYNIHKYGGLALLQLHHAGMRSPIELIRQRPVCPTDQSKYNARSLTTAEVFTLRDDFVEGAVRAQRSGYDGIEVHAAHGYLIAQFLSAEINYRTDQFGGSFQNRARILFEIIEGIRTRCGKGFIIGVRFSPEKFGMRMEEIQKLCTQLDQNYEIDFLDISLWDYKKAPENKFNDVKNLLGYATKLNLKKTKITIAGNIRNGDDINTVLHAGIDFVTIGRSAILHHDFPHHVMKDRHFSPVNTPVSSSYLRGEGLGPKFIDYMHRWPGFVE